MINSPCRRVPSWFDSPAQRNGRLQLPIRLFVTCEEMNMNLKSRANAIARIWLSRISISGLAVFYSVGVQAQVSKTPYPAMAAIQNYLMERNAEIELARSAAFPAISRDAEVLVLTRNGYEVAVKGSNGFLCMVERSWHAPEDDPEFWNPNQRGPICFNAEAARSQAPISLRKTKIILASASKEQMIQEIKAAFDKKELVEPEPGSMCYMLSSQGHLNDRDGHWHPHLMFFVPLTEPGEWGANLKGSPVFAGKDPLDRRTIFMVPVTRWSDGTLAPPM
jgi:hypothetical protein